MASLKKLTPSAKKLGRATKKLTPSAASKKLAPAATKRTPGAKKQTREAKKSVTQSAGTKRAAPAAKKSLLAGKKVAAAKTTERARTVANEPAKTLSKATQSAGAAKPIKSRSSEKVVLLSGGNPQIAKADGDAPVQAYIAAMPGWKSDLGKRIDVIITRNVRDVRKAVKWNSPFYGIEGQGWFLSFHVFNKYVKVTFFAGMSLRPIPPGGTAKSKEARWIDIYEDDEFDKELMAKWVKQAASMPGWIP